MATCKKVVFDTPALKYTGKLAGLYEGDLPEPRSVYTQLINDILTNNTENSIYKGLLTRFIYSLYVEDLGDPFPFNDICRLLYFKLHNIAVENEGCIYVKATVDDEEIKVSLRNDLERAWAKVLFNIWQKTAEITTWPYNFIADGKPLYDWTIEGNISQSGTSTPSNPIYPTETGDKTANLANVIRGKVPRASDGSLVTFEGLTTEYVSFHTGDILSISFEKPVQTKRFYVFYYSGDTLLNTKDLVYGTSISSYGVSETVDRVRIRIDYSGVEVSNVMLNTGSSPLPYEPYGIKIPISCDGTTTNVYLDEVQSERRIKKYEFTGNEADLRMQAAITSTDAIQLPTTQSDYKREPFICSHMPVTSSSTTTSTHGFYGQFLTLCFEKSMGLDTLEKMRTYLQQQYANGTPVCVWYVLATPTTGIVNEPIRKIGNYADSISNVAILDTVPGDNTIDVDTTLKPSKMTITYS